MVPVGTASQSATSDCVRAEQGGRTPLAWRALTRRTTFRERAGLAFFTRWLGRILTFLHAAVVLHVAGR
jgi:hypothetical protein